jgi:hypothetical protein
MNLITLNTPDFFAEEETNDLSNYLDKEIELYYVLLVEGKVVGCGGINFAEKVIKAQAQGLKLADTPEADEVYTREWALNTAAVTKLLLGD